MADCFSHFSDIGAILVDRDVRQRCSLGPGRDHDGFGRKRLALAVAVDHVDLPRCGDRSSAKQTRDLALAKQVVDAVAEP